MTPPIAADGAFKRALPRLVKRLDDIKPNSLALGRRQSFDDGDRLVRSRRPRAFAHPAGARPAELADDDLLVGKGRGDPVADGDEVRRRARRRYRKVLPIGQDVDGDEIDRALHVRIAQPKFPHVGIGDRHRHLRLDFANDGDEVCRRHFAAQQHFVADDDRRDDVRIVLGVGNRRRDLPAGPIRIAGDPHTVQHLQPVPPRALEHVIAAVVDRIGADAAGVFGEQRQIFIDLLRRHPGTLDQRILRSPEWGI